MYRVLGSETSAGEVIKIPNEFLSSLFPSYTDLLLAIDSMMLMNVILFFFVLILHIRSRYILKEYVIKQGSREVAVLIKTTNKKIKQLLDNCELSVSVKKI